MNVNTKLVLIVVWVSQSLIMLVDLTTARATASEPDWIASIVIGFLGTSFGFGLYFLIRQAVKDAYVSHKITQ